MTRAERDGDGWRITGDKSLVLHGGSADTLLVTARTAGEHRERHGIGLFLVRADAPGVTRRGYPTQDGMRAAEINLVNAPGEPLGDPAEALPILEQANDEMLAALCAEAVGVMDAMHAMTLDYMKTRKQFGRAIGENQALQHRAVDMYVSLEQARSMALYATMMASEADPVQRHGGIGVTMEYAVGHHFKRMTMIERGFGDTDSHLAALARLGGLIAA